MDNQRNIGIRRAGLACGLLGVAIGLYLAAAWLLGYERSGDLTVALYLVVAGGAVVALSVWTRRGE
ncbi:hypothetical protein GCM10027591_11570 [Zhihengliuella somnathii]